MANTNCLEGIRCPDCGNEDEFRIECHVVMKVTDDGVMDSAGDVEWDEDSWCFCPQCEREGKLALFRVEEEDEDTKGQPTCDTKK